MIRVDVPTKGGTLDNIPGKKFVEKAEETGNEVPVPMTRRRLGLVELLKLTFKEVGEDHVAAFAGNLTYKTLFALFPFFVFLLSLLGIFGATGLVTSALDSIGPSLPEGAATFIENQLVSIAERDAEGAFTVSAVVAILLALWGVSGAFRSIMESMNVMYEIEEDRPFWKQAMISVLLSLSIAVLLIAALVLVVFGPTIGGAVADAVGLGSIFQIAWNIVQWPVLISLVLLAFAFVYYFAPDVEQRFKWISPGSIVAVVMWLLFSLAFSLYVNYSSESLGATYGTFAGIIILMLYIYYSAFIVLVGAEMNQVIEEHIPKGKNEGEKEINDGGQERTLKRPSEL